MAHALPERKYIYQDIIADSRRWDHYTPRPGDIVISTAYKAGTTWMQMICALLILRTRELAKPLSQYSPWLDKVVPPIEEVIAELEAQTHRRFIKTHMPLDALPYFPEVSYIYVGRDPRDVFISMQDHMENTKAETWGKLGELAKARGVAPRPTPPEDIHERWRLWMTKGAFSWERDGWPSWSLLRHAESWWAFRHRPNILMVHHNDLLRDLNSEMHRVADFLGEDIADDIWPGLVEAATFTAMRAQADTLAPGADLGQWKENKEFFRKGTTGRWQEVLNAEDLQLYAQTRSRLPAEVALFLEQGRQAGIDPRSVPETESSG